MSQTLTLDVPDEILEHARSAASASNRPIQHVLVEWLRRGGVEDIDGLPDDRLMELCGSTMDASRHRAMSDLLQSQSERLLDGCERSRLSELMDEYRSGLLLKARAIRAAAVRGMKPAV